MVTLVLVLQKEQGYPSIRTLLLIVFRDSSPTRKLYHSGSKNQNIIIKKIPTKSTNYDQEIILVIILALERNFVVKTRI